MREKYEITGIYFVVGNRKYRKYLDIKHKSSNLKNPDIMVVMMNPGSSYPLDGNNNNHLPSLAEPDNTQDQIIKVMRSNSFEYARILNLSDLRTPKSKELYEFIRSEEAIDTKHSIFSEVRKSEFNSLFIKNVPVIYAWGVNPALTNLATLAINRINHPNPIGYKKEGKELAYYHPLPRSHKKQIEWVETINKKIRERMATK